MPSILPVATATPVVLVPVFEEVVVGNGIESVVNLVYCVSKWCRHLTHCMRVARRPSQGSLILFQPVRQASEDVDGEK